MMAKRQTRASCGSGWLTSRFMNLTVAVVVAATAVFAIDPALAQEQNVYRQVAGIDSRRLVWFLAQMHLFFGAFVLGVPLFAVIIEIVGWKNGEARFDKLAYEFTSLLSVAYATTAALGGLLAFALFTLYPTFMGYMAGTFKDVMFIYALLFFGETFALYLYYYGWNWLKGGKPFGNTTQWVFKALGSIVILAGVVFFFGRLRPRDARRHACVHHLLVHSSDRYRPGAHRDLQVDPHLHRHHAECGWNRDHDGRQQLGRIHDEPGRCRCRRRLDGTGLAGL